MSLETLKTPSRPIDIPSDKPQVDRGEHGNLDRPGAVLHPRAGAGWNARPAPAGWARHLAAPAWR